jgi:hypothetical protein
MEGTQRGSGIWGREFNDKCFQVIQTLSVNAGLSSHEVALKLLTNMINPTLVQHDGLSYALVEPTKTVFRSVDWTESTKISLFRDFGFRRVGDSSWFAYAYKPTHPANALLAEHDYDPPVSQPSATEVQKLEFRLEILRTRAKKNGKIIDVSTEFRGHTEENVRTLIAARKAENPSNATPGTLQVKYGCTCGRCLGGFMSTRMQFVLHKQASKIYKGIFPTISADHTRIHLQKNSGMIPRIMGGYAWAFVKEPLKSLIYRSKDVGLGYCYVSPLSELLRIIVCPIEVLSHLNCSRLQKSSDFRFGCCRSL